MSAARKQVYALVGDAGRSAAHAAVTSVLVVAIAAALGAGMVETLTGTGPGAATFAAWSRYFAASVFSVELAARLWIAPESKAGIAADSDLHARLGYLLSVLGLVDVIAVLPGWAALVFPVGREWFEIAAALSLFKLARCLPALALIGTVVAREARSLMAAVAAMCIMLVVAATVMYLLERDVQPEIFRSIPHSLWWGIVTMATVGYGDMAPVSLLGRIFGGFTMLLGIAMFAVPAGILASGFAEEMKRRDFVVTWQAVAGVPLFARLDASRIATIARLLKPEIVSANHVIVHRGEPAHAMYFIMEGEVEVDVQPVPVRLKPGQFFGEVALLRDLHRTATVTAVRECRLLTLDVADFRNLAAQYPELKRQVELVAAERQPGAGEERGAE
ncbi:MAG: cyclic nucleotide-gated ion channel [Dongiaceae bacterium]